MRAGSPQEQGWDIPKSRQGQDPLGSGLGSPCQSQGHRELRVTVSPTRVASGLARAASLGDRAGNRDEEEAETRPCPITEPGGAGAPARVYFWGRIHPPPRLLRSCTTPEPPATGTAPAQRGNNINSKLGGARGARSPSAEGTLDVLGLEERLLHGHGPQALGGAAVPRLARLPRGTGRAGDAGDALLPHGARGTHLPVAWWPLGTWKRWRERGERGGDRVRGWQQCPAWGWGPRRGRGLTWGSRGAAVPHQPHAFLAFLSFGARLTWEREGDGEG